MATWRTGRRDPWAAPAGLDMAGAAAAVTVAALIAAAVPADHPGWRVAVLAVAVLVASAGTGNLAAAATAAALAALTTNGFLIGRFGQLSWHGLPDLYRTAVLAGAAAVGFGAAVLVQYLDARSAAASTASASTASAAAATAASTAAAAASAGRAPTAALRTRARRGGGPGRVRPGAGSRG